MELIVDLSDLINTLYSEFCNIYNIIDGVLFGFSKPKCHNPSKEHYQQTSAGLTYFGATKCILEHGRCCRRVAHCMTPNAPTTSRPGTTACSATTTTSATHQSRHSGWRLFNGIRSPAVRDSGLPFAARLLHGQDSPTLLWQLGSGLGIGSKTWVNMV